MISFSQAIHILTSHVTPLQAQPCPLADAVGRVLEKPIIAPLNLPSFTNSAMDGYAAKQADLITASPETPVFLTCTGQSAAGGITDEEEFGPSANECWEIMTGAILPPTCDTIVPVEIAQKQGQKIMFTSCPQKGAHIRKIGEDVRCGEQVLQAGLSLQPHHISLLAALGISTVDVIRRPRVAILTTGDEIVANLAQPLQTGQIYNSSFYYLLAALPLFGAEVVFKQTVKDDIPTALSIFKEALTHHPDMIITTGAVSMGTYDFIPEVLKKLKARTHFHKIAQRPGKPVLAAQLPHNIWCVSLPGNPIATMTSLRFIAGHILRKMQNMPDEQPLRLSLYNGVTSKKGVTHFQKAKIQNQEDTFHVETLNGQASFMQKSLADIDSWLVVPEEKETLNAGSIVDVYPAYWSQKT